MIVSPKIWAALYGSGLLFYCITSRIINKKLGIAWIILLSFCLISSYVRNRESYMAKDFKNEAVVIIPFAVIGFLLLQSRLFIHVFTPYG